MSANRRGGVRDPDACEVLVVGAGPTGLTLSLDLARRGVDVRLVDRSAEPRRGPAVRETLHPRTLEILADLGVDPRLLADEGAAARVRFYAPPGRGDRGRLLADLSWFDPPRRRQPGRPYSASLLVPQPTLERVLGERLATYDVRVESGCEVYRLRQDRGWVRVWLHGPDGDEREIRASYVVGADGADSMVRGQVGISSTAGAGAAGADAAVTVERRTYAGEFALAGMDATTGSVDEAGSVDAAGSAGAGAHVWRTDDGDVTILAAGPDASAWTLQVMVSADEVSARPDVPLTLRTWEDLFHRRTGWQHVRFVDSGPVSSYPVRPHVADALRADRVFLAGDAAHGGPRGGTGLDAGLQDAYNLGWKLDAVVRGAGDDLVDSYEAERLPVARSLLGQPADLFLALLEEAGSRPRRLRVRRPRLFTPARSARRRGSAGAGSPSDPHYRDSRLSQELGGREIVVHSGDRMPDVRLWSPVHGSDVALFDILRGTHWTVIGLGSLSAEVVFSLRATFGSAVRGEVIGGGMSTVPGVTLLDRYGEARQLLGRRGGSVLLVRPDGYLGLRCGVKADIISAYLEDLVGTGADIV